MTHPIEIQSYQEIAKRFNYSIFSKSEAVVAQRIVHATADFELAESLLFSDNAISTAMNAILQKAPVICDVEMVRAGITRYPSISYLPTTTAEPTGYPTRSYKAMRHAATAHKTGAIFVIGCAPTALRALIELDHEEWFDPALIIGLPVGFIDSAESKEALTKTRFNYISNVGVKGGSPAASAAFNSLVLYASDNRNE